MASHQPAQDYLNESDINLSFDPPSPTTLDAPFSFGQHSPSFSHTPAYTGSPYSQASDLSFGEEDNNFGLYSGDIHIASPEYNPNDFDPATNSLLMFSDEYAHTLSQLDSNPSLAHQSPGMYNDYSSPASSNGGGDDVGAAASTSQVSPSPRLEVQHSFENMSFQSPAWGTEPLPLDPSAQGSLMDTRRRSSVFSGRSASPHMQKPQSPPRLMMPDNDGSPSFAPNGPSSSGSTGNQNFVQPPVINAPDDGGDNGSGPSLRIVPATPVSGGGLGNPGDGRMPFQRPAGNNLGVIDEPFRGDFSAQRSPPMPGQAPNAANISRPPSSSPQQQPAKFTFPQNREPSPLPTTGPGAGNFLFPTGPRSRSKSDTSVNGGSPVALWNNSPFSRQHESVDDSALSLDDHHSGSAPPQPSTVNMNDITPATQHQQSANNNNFLTPDGFSGMMATNGLRRSKSDSGNQRMGHVRGSRSEDIRFSTNGGLLAVPGMGVNVPASLAYQQPPFLSPTNDPPPAIRQQQGFTPGHAPSLSYGSQSPSMGYAALPQHRLGHVRRASSGSRSERGISAWEGDGTGFVGSGQRASPYPSPNASPHVRYDDLPVNDPLDGGYDPMRPPSVQPPQVNMGGMPVQDPQIVVSKQNVTTSRTRNASHNRRKQEATFVCPVPGCGSTFTRSFNLRGHIRSHNEEKPYLCHWPGCGKGFARQHDCKRHEQLHTNYRPFTCEGCQKPFARMDALNRHLRSEGGAECQRILEQNGNLPAGVNNGSGSKAGSSTPPNSSSASSKRKSGSHSRSDNLSDSSPPQQLPIPLMSGNGVRSMDVSMSGGGDELWSAWPQQTPVTL